MPEMLTIAQVAKLTGKSTKTIRNYIKTGRLKAIMEPSPFGHRYVIAADTLEGLQCQTPTLPLEPLETQLTPVLPLETTLEALEKRMEDRLVTLENRIVERVEGRLAERDRRLDEFIGEWLEEKKKPSWWARLWGS
ncbi:MAG: helix-turn-helix domain-containing protein [Dehalococcoidia bacterium]